jgi:hypothetical protein
MRRDASRMTAGGVALASRMTAATESRKRGISQAAGQRAESTPARPPPPLCPEKEEEEEEEEEDAG